MRKIAKISTIECFPLESPLLLCGENLRTNASRHDVAREARAALVSSEPIGLGVIGSGVSGCIGRGVDGPVKESTSFEGSNGGEGGIPLPAEKLPHMKRCAPTLEDFRGLPDSMVDIEDFLPSWAAIEPCLDSGIKPWEISVGVGGTVCLVARGPPALLVDFTAPEFAPPSLENPLNLYRT